MRELACTRELQSNGGRLAADTATYAVQVLSKCQTKRDALALWVRGWLWGSHPHHLKTQLFPNVYQRGGQVPKIGRRAKDEEERFRRK
jgi:hypothetical protein